MATRYDRCPKVFLSAIALAATMLFWLWVLRLAHSPAWLLSAGEHSADVTGYEGYCPTEGRGQTGSGSRLRSPPDTALAKTVAHTDTPPHPALVELVRLLAREAARKDIAAQRPNTK